MAKRSVPDTILHTAMEVISDFGVRRFTVDELARRVGLSRVTIYRHFENRQEVLKATMLHELGGFLTEVETAVAGYAEPDERIVEGFVLAVSRLRQHEVLQRLLRTEPELILPLLTIQGGPVIAIGSDMLRRLSGEMDGILAETVARMVLSLVLTPASGLGSASDAEVRAVATCLVSSPPVSQGLGM